MKSWVVWIAAVLMLLASCSSSEEKGVKYHSPKKSETQAEVRQGDFIYRLVSEKEIYQQGSEVQLYAELEYAGEKEEVTIYHAASPFYFPITEMTRGYEITYSMDQPLLTTKLKKGKPLREDYRGGGGYDSGSDEGFKAFIQELHEKGFPKGRYQVSGSADFYTGSGTDGLQGKQDYKIEAKIMFRVEEKRTADSKAKLEFENVKALPKDRIIRAFQVLNDQEIAAVISEKPDSPELYAGILNVHTLSEQVLWTGDIYEHSLNVVRGAAGQQIIQFLSYDRETEKYSLKRFVGTQEQYAGSVYQTVSPDGRWIASYRDGIVGTSTSDVSVTKWTNGEWDGGVLWLPDSSGFVYLSDTGKQIGDGAGPVYELASYDLRSGRRTVLPYRAGYWGRIEWLNPGKVLIASNGFDDTVGLKIVDLVHKQEEQLLDARSSPDIEYLIAPHKGIVIKTKGQFQQYNTDGQWLKTLPWPANLDPDTQLNPAYTADTTHEQPYYQKGVGGGEVGPSMLQYSPDGQRLAYLWGRMGWHIDDQLPGQKLVLGAGEADQSPVFLTEKYYNIHGYRWMDNSKLMVHFSTVEQPELSYLGILNVKGSANPL